MTEKDIAFHWPLLAQEGFGTNQIRQILDRLAQVNEGAERLIQGLTYAEWELAAGKMYDASGNPVGKPVPWVFTILGRQGYYNRPEGYISPEEQAEKDAAQEAQCLKAAREARQKAEVDAWVASLSPEERSDIVNSRKDRFPMPDNVILGKYSREVVAPQKSTNNTQDGSHEM